MHSVFSSLCCMRISVFEVKLLTRDQYQNAIPKSVPLYELKKIQLHFTLMTRASTGHLKTFITRLGSSIWVWIEILQLITKHQTNKQKTKQTIAKHQTKNKTQNKPLHSSMNSASCIQQMFHYYDSVAVSLQVSKFRHDKPSRRLTTCFLAWIYDRRWPGW